MSASGSPWGPASNTEAPSWRRQRAGVTRMKDGILHWKRKCLEAGAQGTANRVILARSRGVSVMASGSSFTDALHPRDFRKNVLPVLSMSRSPCLPWGLSYPRDMDFSSGTLTFFSLGPAFLLYTGVVLVWSPFSWNYL